MRSFFSILSLIITLYSATANAQTADSTVIDVKAARKELMKCLKEARTIATEGTQATKGDAVKSKFSSARAQIDKAKNNPLFSENKANVLLAEADVEYLCYNTERNNPAIKEKIDNKTLYTSSYKAFMMYSQAYDLLCDESNPKANSKVKNTILKKAWPLFTATGGLRVNAAYAYEEKDWKQSHACWDLYITALESQLVKDAAAHNDRFRGELIILSTDSIVNHAKYFRALTSVLAEDHETAIEELKDMRYLGYETNFVFQELARQYLIIGEQTLYENTLIEGAKLLPKDPWFAQNLMNISLENKDYDAASLVIDALLKADPENPINLSLKGTLVELQGNSDEALKYLEKAYSIDSTNVDINSNLGRVWYNKGNVIETAYFDKRQYTIAEELSMPYYLKAVNYYLKAYEADTDRSDKTIANGIRNVLYKQFMKADCPNPQELIKKYNQVSKDYGMPTFE